MNVKHNVPKAIIDTYQQIHLDINIMYVNKVSYMTTICNHIKLLSCVMMNNHDVHRVSNAITMIIKRYNQCGLRVTSVCGIDIFGTLKDWLADMHIKIETYNARAHLTTIEMYNRILKKRIKYITYNMPFIKLPRDFLVEVVLQTVSLMNSLPKRGGIHPTLSPRQIFTGNKLCVPRHKIGNYVQGYLSSGMNTTKIGP